MPTKKVLRLALWVTALFTLFVPAALARSAHKFVTNAPQTAADDKTANSKGTDRLDQVLAAMDANAKAFRNAQANFTAKMWNSVINGFVPPDDQGKIYLRKVGSQIEASAIYSEPSGKQIVFMKDKLEVSQNGQVNTYDAAAHHDELETFLVLGFGSSGEEMRNSFEIKDLGPDKVGSADTEKLQLVPKSASVLAHVPKIILWVDPKLGISRQQQIYVEKEGDYRLALYTDIKINKGVSGSVFNIKGSK